MRPELTQALEELDRLDLHYRVETFGTAVEGELDDILAAVRSIHARLLREGRERFELELRLREEPAKRGIADELAGFDERQQLGMLPGLQE